MLKILGDALSSLKPRKDDDYVDRLNYVVTTSIFMFFAATIGMKQYVGQPIQCWVPAQFKGGWEKYSETYCFIENTYYVNMTEKFPERSERADREVPYYQWVSFILVGQTALFMLPKMLWNAFNVQTSLSLKSVINATKLHDSKKILRSRADVEGAIQKSGYYLNNVISTNQRRLRWDDNASSHSKQPHRRETWKGIYYKSYVTKLYLLFKLLNIANSIGQLIFIGKFLGSGSSLWGYEVLRDLLNGYRWKESGRFPRVTFCDVHVRDIGDKMLRHTFQCVLMINMFNEKIYIFIWFWLTFVSAMNIINFIKWFYDTHFEMSILKYVSNLLSQTSDSLPAEDELRGFVEDSIFVDGVTALRLIAINNTDYLAAQLAERMFRAYRSNKSSRRSSDSKSHHSSRVSIRENHNIDSMASSVRTTVTEVMTPDHEKSFIVEAKREDEYEKEPIV